MYQMRQQYLSLNVYLYVHKMNGNPFRMSQRGLFPICPFDIINLSVLCTHFSYLFVFPININDQKNLF